MNLVERLETRAAQYADGWAYLFLKDGESEHGRLSWPELSRRSRIVASMLEASGGRGERALLLFPPGLDFVAAFLGCLYAGALAVPAQPARLRRHAARLRHLARDAEPRWVLTAGGRTGLRRAREALPELAGAHWLAVDDPAEEATDPWSGRLPRKDDPAFLQYTSGSTASPRGVVVTHRNLEHNLALIRRIFGQDESSVVVGWLPVYHDMGLIGNVLQPLFSGGRCILMPPLAFLQRPRRWLATISRFGGTTSGGPNFAYDLCVDRIPPEAREGLDLSSWRVAFNGSELVRSETMERFERAFSPWGFRGRAFSPCYGLAETTLMCTGTRSSDRPRVRAAPLPTGRARGGDSRPGEAQGPRSRVGCGELPADHQVVVVDPESRRRLDPGEVGEIWVGGPSVAAGYWNRPDETARMFRAVLADGGGPFLRTGDLGFVVAGELFVSGRLKELVILRGRNFHPQDLERTAEQAHPDLCRNAGAAFPVSVDGEERLVLVHELERRSRAPVRGVVAAIRRALAEEHGIAAHRVVLIRERTLPRTTSGKVRRLACRELLAEGGLQVLADGILADPPREPSSATTDPDEEWGAVGEASLRRLAADVLDREISEVDPARPLTILGLDSLAAAQLAEAVEREVGLWVSPVRLLDGASLHDLARELAVAGASPGPGRGTRGGEADDALRPVSAGQKGLWFVHSLVPGTGAHNLVAAGRACGPLHVGALREAFEVVVERYPVLRSRFHLEMDEPRRRVEVNPGVELVQEGVGGLDDAGLVDRLETEAYRPFDLEEGPLVRLVVLDRGEAEHYVLLALHHIVADLPSLAVLLREVGLVYGAADRLQAPELPGITFDDYARWQEELVSGPEGVELFRFWKERLTGVRWPIELSTDRPRPAVSRMRGASVRARIPEPVVAELSALARREGATLFMALLAAFELALARHAGQEELVVASPASGRDATGLSDVVGYLVNPLAMRADLTDDPSFRTHLRATRDEVLGALGHGSLPFPAVIEALGLTPDPARPAVYQALFALQDTGVAGAEALAAVAVGEAGVPLELGPIRLESIALESRAIPTELELWAARVGGELVLSFRFDPDLYDGTTSRRFLHHLQVLLEGVVAGPGRRCSELPLLTPAERFQALVEWNDRETRGPMPSLWSLVSGQAELRPDAVAVACEGRLLSYAGLVRRARVLGRDLRRRGLKREDRVALLLERTPAMLVALLAATECGATYVPLDPEHPRHRLAFFVSDANAAFVVSEKGLRRRAHAIARGTPVLLVEEVTPEQEAVRNPRLPEAGPDAAAYVIYTSGSTGAPKGVVVTHGALSNLLLSMRREPGLTARDTVLAVTTISFDIAVLELFLPLLVGGRVVIAPRALASDPVGLGRTVAEERVTLVQATPSSWRLLVETGWRGGPELVALSGGEALSEELAERLAPRVGRTWNLYGPTETTVWSALARLAPPSRPVSLGRPIDGTAIYPMDPRLRPVPAGVPGELVIGGSGLARGYAGAPALTAERFVPDAFDNPGGRLYKTGDLGRWHADGSLHFLGRRDDQVKVRGFRIEPAEIEAVLSRCRGVESACVQVRRVAADDLRLVAFVMAEAGVGSVDPAEIRKDLLERLPRYMVPADFVALDSLPLTPSGKVDRKALAAVPVAPERREQRAGNAGTTRERRVAAICAEVLGVPGVEPGEDLFALGCHSLLLVRILSRLRRELGCEISLPDAFRAPTAAGLAALAEARRGSGAGFPPLRPRRRVGDLPLSIAQERIWFIEQLDDGGPAYSIPAALAISGPLDLGILARSLDAVLRRHEILRTTFPAVDGEPVQRVHPPRHVCLPVVDLRHLGDTGAGDLDARRLATRRPDPGSSHRPGLGAVERLAADEASRPFELSEEAPVRFVLLLTGSQSSVLLVTVHHLAFDGGSVELFLRELGSHYEAGGEAPPAVDPPIQYGDYALWERRYARAAEEAQAALAYWRHRLTGAPALLELPTDRPRPARRRSRGGRCPVRVSAGLRDRVLSLAATEASTLFTAVVAALQALLARYSGQDDICVGTPVSGRESEETEALLGLLVNTVVLRTDLSGRPSARTLLDRVLRTVLEAHSHRHVAFERLVQELQPERNPSFTPLFQVMTFLQRDRSGGTAPVGLRWSWLETYSATAKFDLNLMLQDGPEGMEGALEYDADLFDATTAQRLCRHWLSLLEAMASDPDRPVADLPILTRPELWQVVGEWNDTEGRHPGVRTLHRLSEERSALQPDAVALEAGSRLVTFGELDSRANRLAHLLHRLGVGPGVPVGIHLERGLEMVVAVLGVLKAGGAYVPLPERYPLPRIRRILHSLRSGFLVTERRRLAAVGSLVSELPGPRGVVTVDDVEPGGGLPVPVATAAELATMPVSRPRCDASGDDVAYVIFTSGSTGEPKGVVVRHRPAVNVVSWVNRTFDVKTGDRLLWVTSLGFDLSVYDLFGVLGAGGTVRVAQAADLEEPARLVASLCRDRITFWDSAPAALQLVLPHLEQIRPPDHLHLVFLSGDWIPLSLPETLARVCPGAQLVSLGGATEATIWSNWFPVRVVRPEWVSIPYGRPITNARYHVLDPRSRPVPPGVPGDLFIGGGCLASGYAASPRLTGERFVPDPFSPSPGAILYRTGDRARYRPDGNLEFLGRVDRQVKVRGFRVEPGEIEAALEVHPQVSEALVEARADADGGRRLVGYVVVREAVAPSAEELRRFVAERLPRYMVPSAFMHLDAIPVTANGKVDRSALPSPETGTGLDAGVSGPPRTPVEQLVAGHWARLLGVDRVGLEDDFFELGGQSLLAARLMARIRETFGVDLPVRTLFEAPSVGALAAAVDAARAGRESTRLPPLEPMAHRGAVPLSLAQEPIWLASQTAPAGSYNVFRGVRLRGVLHLDRLRRSFAAAVGRHSILRSKIELTGEGVVQIPLEFRGHGMPVVDLRALPATHRERALPDLASRESRFAFDLARGRPLRTILVRFAAADHVLLLNVHHVVADAWSLGILIRDVTRLYGAFGAGGAPELDPPTVEYADFAAWQRALENHGPLQDQLAYWRDRLADAPVKLELPVDRPWREAQIPDGARLPIRADGAELRDRLADLGVETGTTPFMVVVAAFQVFLCHACGVEDVALLTNVAGRTRPEVADVVGCFVNQIVVRTDLSGAPTFRELLARVRRSALDAYAHQDVPFERVVRELWPGPANGGPRPFQVKVELQEAPWERLDLPGVEAELLDLGPTLIRQHLHLVVSDTPRGFFLRLHYDRNLFEAETVERFGEHLLAVLRQVTDRPETTVRELVDRLAAADRERTRTRLATRRGRNLRRLERVARTRGSDRSRPTGVDPLDGATRGGTPWSR